MKKIYAILLTSIIALTMIACSSEQKSKDTKAAQSKAPSEAAVAPAFALLNDQGDTVKLSDYAGKVIILDFWATWCPPCRQEIPHFIELQNEYGEKGLQVIGVSVDQQGWEVVKPFVKEQGINYPILMAGRDVYREYQELLPGSERGGIPFTFVIDRKGVVQHKFVGYRDKAVFEEAVKTLF